MAVWHPYKLTLEVNKLVGGVPKDPALVQRWLEARKPLKVPDNAVPIEVIAAEVISDLPTAEPDEDLSGWTTFRIAEGGQLYIRGNDLRAHLKDCAQVHASSIRDQIKNFRAKFVDRVYIQEECLLLGKSTPDGTDEHPVHVMTRLGPRTGLKRTDFVVDVTLHATVLILNDGVITRPVLETLLEYGTIHGMGADRSMGYGRYSWALAA